MHRDPKLLEAYRKGEKWAYETLYDDYADYVKRFLLGGFTFMSRGRPCRYRGNNSMVDADGVVQETFARAFAPRTRVNYDGERPFRNYLFSIAKNLVLREVQRRDRVLQVDNPEEAVDRIALQNQSVSLREQKAAPDDNVADDELRAVTKTFIAELDDEGRAFFGHRFANEMTQQATASAMGVTRARVKLLEKQLRQRFLELLRGHGYFVGYEPQPRWTREAAA